jgi:pimeloyl-ACP methyl ester carboxylesterase
MDVAFTPCLLAEQLANLLSALNIHEPLHVVGFSLGCYVASLFAANHPGQVASVKQKLLLTNPLCC